MLMVPGNHDLNIVDRANPARLELRTSPKKRLRKVRALSAMAAIQGARVRVVDHSSGRLGESLAAALAPRLGRMVMFADAGKPRLTMELLELWTRAFPMVPPPDRDDGLGIILLFERRDAFFLHQCAWNDLVGTSPRDRNCQRAISARVLGDRPPSSSRRVPARSEGSFRTHWDGLDQRQMVRSSSAISGRPSGVDAWSSACRLGRGVCWTADCLGAVSSHGSDGRPRHLFLYTHIGCGTGSASKTAAATAGYDRRPVTF